MSDRLGSGTGHRLASQTAPDKSPVLAGMRALGSVTRRQPRIPDRQVATAFLKSTRLSFVPPVGESSAFHKWDRGFESDLLQRRVEQTRAGGYAELAGMPSRARSSSSVRCTSRGYEADWAPGA